MICGSSSRAPGSRTSAPRWARVWSPAGQPADHVLDLWMGTAALSERDYVHEAIDAADVIIAIGHDTVEKPPFLMGQGGPTVIHVSYTPANVEEVYFPHASVVGDVGPSLPCSPAGSPAGCRTRRRCCTCGTASCAAPPRVHRGPVPDDPATDRGRCSQA